MDPKDPMKQEREAYERFVAAAIADQERYFQHTNQILGIGGFVYGIGALQLAAASFFAWLSGLFLIAVWADGFANYRSKMHTLIPTRHPRATARAVLRHTWNALMGWLFLACIAVGLLTEHGFQP